VGPELVVAGCSVFWGSIGLVVREVDLPAVTIVAFRVGIAAAAIAAWLLLRPDDRGRRLVVHRPVRTLLQGVVLAVHWVLFFAALQRAPVGLVTLLVFLAPVILAGIAPFALGERLTGRIVVALGLGLVGTALLVGLGADGAEVAGIVYAVLAAVLLAVNWYVYVWAVQHDRIFQGSLGYYINPLLYVLVGVLFFGERLRRPQTFAVLLAAAGVAVLTFSGAEFGPLRLMMRPRIRPVTPASTGVFT